ncbi:MAG: BamA/TamA family outer membrane protein [Myxococcaceae bacterium]|nr:BamA/TamA family outer membrane protein [Myxococcaceae bacterium]MCA3013229.1 BamA/TamA family outer membrane protein [Myxococcaceae bacterium]
MLASALLLTVAALDAPGLADAGAPVVVEHLSAQAEAAPGASTASRRPPLVEPGRAVDPSPMSSADVVAAEVSPLAADAGPLPMPPADVVAPEALPLRVEAVEVRGLSWTKPFVALRELQLAVPGEVTGEQWALGLTRLWNCGLFSRVDGRLERRPEGVVAVVELEERFSLNPLFSFGVGGGAAWVRAGLNDTNFLGRFLEWGLRYERFLAFNGGQVWFRDPRLFGRRLTGLAQVEWLFRPRPEYTRRRLQGLVDVLGELEDRFLFGLRVEAFRDEYSAPLAGEARLPVDLQGVLVHPSVRMGRVDTVRLRERGASLEVRTTLGVTSDPRSPVFLQSFVEALGFWMLGERFNLALRAQLGLSTPAPTEQRFYLGGLDLIRGFDDSSVRTEQFLASNVELRGVAFDSTWFAVVPAAFVDGAVVRAESREVRGLVSAGLGVRLLVPKMLRTGLRADVAVTLAGGRPQVGFAFGVFQFFSSTDRFAIR